MEDLLLFVQVHEVNRAHVAHFVHEVPSIVIRHGNLVHIHVIGSNQTRVNLNSRVDGWLT